MTSRDADDLASRILDRRNGERDVHQAAVLGQALRLVAVHLFTTPIFIVRVLVEWTDLVFAVDSIPAVLAVAEDPFIVSTSNVIAILGLKMCRRDFRTIAIARPKCASHRERRVEFQGSVANSP